MLISISKLSPPYQTVQSSLPPSPHARARSRSKNRQTSTSVASEATTAGKPRASPLASIINSRKAGQGTSQKRNSKKRGGGDGGGGGDDSNGTRRKRWRPEEIDPMIAAEDAELKVRAGRLSCRNYVYSVNSVLACLSPAHPHLAPLACRVNSVYC